MAVIKPPGPKAQAIAGILLSLLPLWLIAYLLRVRTPLFAKPRIIPHNPFTVSRETFLREWTDNHMGNIPDHSTISYLCAQPSIEWRPNVVLNLDDANGGIGNVRGNIFDFVCLAILTGSSIMLPGFQARSDSDLSSLWNGKIAFDTFFDEDYFVSTFAKACPQMAIYKPTEEHAMVPALQNRYGPLSMRSDLMESGGGTPEAAVTDFNAWLIAQNPEPSNFTLVNVGRTLWEGLDTHSLPSPIRQDFGGALRLHPEVRRLAAITTYNLGRRYGLRIDPRLPYYPKAFLGAHLRTESDAKNAGWLDSELHANFSGQTDAYLSQAIARNLKVIYTASGNDFEISRFAAKAWDLHKFNVTSKTELLTGADLVTLQNMTWDQQGLVDYEVLRRCSYLAGFARSSFGFNVAITRSELLDMAGGQVEPLWLGPTKDDSVAYEDRLSKIWGRFPWQEERMIRGAWP